MNIQYNEFIGIYDNVYPNGYCQHLINEFDRFEKSNVGFNRWQTERVNTTIKNDHQIHMSLIGHSTNDFEGENITSIFFNGLQNCFEEYIHKFSSLHDIKLRASVMKMQRIPSGGGYHVWHFEQGPGDFKGRVIVYMLYLNTLNSEEAGETEFLYQQQRFKPTENQMILWPASYTHVHRGNTVFGKKSKYIVTGWFCLD